MIGEFGEWSPITIHFDGEIVPRENAQPFKGAIFAAFSGDLVFSKIDARNGAIGVVPSSIPKVAVTTEYPVFYSDAEDVLTEFLRLATRLPSFQGALRDRATGTSGRKRVTPEDFLDIHIPLPSINGQLALLDAYKEGMDEADHFDAKAVLISDRSRCPRRTFATLR